MVRIARRVPADRDIDVAALAPEILVSQLDRLLASLPELPDPDASPKSEPERSMEVRTGRDGWTGPVLPARRRGRAGADRPDRRPRRRVPGPQRPRSRHRHPPRPAHPDPTVRRVTWAAGLVRRASAATDALDGTLQRTGNPGDRHQLVVHHDITPTASSVRASSTSSPVVRSKAPSQPPFPGGCSAFEPGIVP
jgi:hypothetical protein